MEDPALREEFARDVVLLKYVGINPIVVHGGGPGDHRATWSASACRSSSSAACGVSDADDRRGGEDGPRRQGQQGHRPAPQPPRPARGRPVRRRRPAVPRRARRPPPDGEDIGFVGRIERVDVDVLDHIAQDYIPVIASVGADREGNSLQRQRRRGGGRRGARARRLQGHVPHRRRRAGCATRPTRRAWSREAARRRGRAARSDGSRAGCGPSSQACVDAIHGGVTLAHIVDGRVPHSLLLELFTDAGIGTKIRAAA